MTRRLVVIGAMPPPVNGQSKNLKRIFDDLRNDPRLSVVSQNVSAGALSKSLVSHVRKGGRMLRAAALLFHAARRGEGKPILYLVADGGRGLIYTLRLVQLARWLGYEIALQHRTFHYVDNESSRMRALHALVAEDGFHVFLCATMRDRFFARYGTPCGCFVIGNQSQYSDVATCVSPVASRSKDAALRVGILSNLYPNKGIDTFLSVARYLLEAGKDTHFCIAGPSPDPKITTEMDRLKADFSDRIEIEGSLFGDRKEAFFNKLDIFYFPTRYPFEAQPNVVIEAQSHGVVVVAPDRGCIASDVRRTGRVIPRSAEADVPLQAEILSGLCDLGRYEIDVMRAASQAQFHADVVEQRAQYVRLIDCIAGDLTATV